MAPQTLFYIIILIIVVSFIVDQILDFLNAKHFNDPIPEALKDVYDATEYEKSQRYKKEKYRFGVLISVISIVATLAFFFFDGFAFVDALARSVSENSIVIALLFFGIILFASDILLQHFCDRGKIWFQQDHPQNFHSRQVKRLGNGRGHWWAFDERHYMVLRK